MNRSEHYVRRRNISPILGLVIVALTVSFTGGCDRKSGAAKPATQSSTGASTHANGLFQIRHPTVASLVPAATDLIVGMTVHDHLVAVSNWDAESLAIKGLPKVGDYRNIDWEKLAQIHPDLLIVQFAPEKMPAGLAERCAQMHITLLNVRIDRLDDIRAAMMQIGEALQEKITPVAAAASFEQHLKEIHAYALRSPSVKTLIVRSEGGTSIPCVGDETFLDELLTISNGTNALAGMHGYPSIDAERLLAINPQAVLVLMPGEPEQVIDRARTFWARQTSIDAVRDHRVYFLTTPYLLLPGFSAWRIANEFTVALHSAKSDASSTPASAPASSPVTESTTKPTQESR